MEILPTWNWGEDLYAGGSAGGVRGGGGGESRLRRGRRRGGAPTTPCDFEFSNFGYTEKIVPVKF